MSEESNKGFGDDLKDKASKLGEEAKETVEDIKEGWNEVSKGGDNKKVLAGILAILVGGLGIHKFILGYNKEGIILLICTLVLGILTCGLAGCIVWVITLVEGIIYLTKSDEEFYQTYQVNKKPWF